MCCSDGVHCCPNGYTCDVAQGSCERGDMRVDWFEKMPAKMPNPVPCDNTHECPTGNTCCKLASGEWGCCPKPNVRPCLSLSETPGPEDIHVKPFVRAQLRLCSYFNFEKKKKKKF